MGYSGRPANFKDHTGEVFEELTVLRYLGDEYWECLCSCGNAYNAITYGLTKGKSKHCRDNTKHQFMSAGDKNHLFKHGKTKTPLHTIWIRMRDRCRSLDAHKYKYYGSKGIVVCDKWESFTEFESWAMVNGYEEGLSIDRIDNNGNYEPSNCRWVPLKEQGQNKSNTIYLNYLGKSTPLVIVAEKLGIKRSILATRYTRGWSNDEIIYGRQKGALD